MSMIVFVCISVATAIACGAGLVIGASYQAVAAVYWLGVMLSCCGAAVTAEK